MEPMKQKELFFQSHRFSACVDADYDIKQSITHIQQTVQWTLYHFYYKQGLLAIGTASFMFTIILNANAMMTV